MASAAVIRIIDSARVHCPGALDGVLRLEFFNTCKDFFNRTDAWQDRIPVFIEGYVSEYDLFSGEPGSINRLLYLESLGTLPNNQSLWPTYTSGGSFGGGFGGDFTNTQSVLASTPNTMPGTQHPPVPRKGSLVRPGVDTAHLKIWDTPSQNELWRATLAINVADPTDCEGIPHMPGWAVDKYNEILLEGLLSRMMMHPAKPYANQQMAAFHGRNFNQGIGVAHNEVLRGANAGGQAWAYPQQFRTRTQRVFR